MKFMGGGERLCCDTIRSLITHGHTIALLSEAFDPRRLEEFFGYERLFDKVNLLLYPASKTSTPYGSTTHLIHHVKGQLRALSQNHFPSQAWDLIFSTQDAGYIPDLEPPVLQWGYFPKHLPSFFELDLPKAIRSVPINRYYLGKIARIGLVLAISQYSRTHLDKEWKRPSVLVYPACNMVNAKAKSNLVITTARAIPEKRLELFWKIAELCPEYKFVMMLTYDPRFQQYTAKLYNETPVNGKIVPNPPKDIYHEILGEAKVYLHLMEGEHFGITIVEAMSASCVPVVHDSGGPKEIVNPESGFRWRNLDEVPQMIHEAMKRAPSSVAKQRAENFSYERFDGRLFSVFAELQARNRKLFP